MQSEQETFDKQDWEEEGFFSCQNCCPRNVHGTSA